MQSKLLLIAIGVLVGVVATHLVISMNEEPEAGPRTASRTDPALREAQESIARLRTENENLKADLRAERDKSTPLAADPGKRGDAPLSTEQPPSPKPAVSTGPLNAEEIEKAIKAFGPSFQASLLGTPKGKEAVKTLREALARAEPGVVQKLIDHFGDASLDIGERLVLAHVLGHSADPLAITALKTTLQDPEAGLMMHRLASHGLAFSDAKDLDPFLMEMAEKSPDTGVRANTAFGLQRRGVEKGVELYFAATDEAFKKGDPAALQYLGGVALMGDKALPLLRERLTTYKDEQARLVLISVIQGKGDRGSIPALEAITQDENAPASLRKAAEGALKAINKPAGQ